METRWITLKKFDVFSHIGLFSGGTISADDVKSAPGFKDRIKLVFVSYGAGSWAATLPCAPEIPAKPPRACRKPAFAVFSRFTGYRA
jgi:hypothetical protein